MLRYLLFCCIVVVLTFSGMRAETSNCTTCRERNVSIALAIEAFRTNFIEQMNLDSVSNAANRSIPTIPEFLSSKIIADSELMSDNVLSDDDQSNMDENTFTMYKPCNEYSSVNSINISDSVFFSRPERLASWRVKSAKLMFYINKGNLTKHYLSLKVRRILLVNGIVQLINVHSSTFVKSDAFGWKQIDVKDIVNEWYYHPNVEIGLQIEAKNEVGRNLVVLPADNFDKSYEPSLAIEVSKGKERSSSRPKRQNSVECTRYPYAINARDSFTSLYNFSIIEPEMLSLYYCHGSCYSEDWSGPYYGFRRLSNTPIKESCCVPIEYTPITVLYYAEKVVMLGLLKNTVIRRCGCM